MASHSISLTTEQEAGVTYARGLSNTSRAQDEQFATNTDYLRFVMTGAADSYAKSADIALRPEVVIAAKDAEITTLKAAVAVKQ